MTPIELFTSFRIDFEVAVSNRGCICGKLQPTERVKYLGRNVTCSGIKPGERHVAIHTGPNYRRNMCLSCAKIYFEEATKKINQFLELPEFAIVGENARMLYVANAVGSRAQVTAKLRFPDGETGFVRLFCSADSRSSDMIEWEIREINLPSGQPDEKKSLIKVTRLFVKTPSGDPDAREELERTIVAAIRPEVGVEFYWQIA